MYYFVCRSQDSAAVALNRFQGGQGEMGDWEVQNEGKCSLTSLKCTSEGGCCSSGGGKPPPGRADSAKRHILKRFIV